MLTDLKTSCMVSRKLLMLGKLSLNPFCTPLDFLTPRDASLFICNCNNVSIYFLAYVDDLIVIENNMSSIFNFLESVLTKISMKDMRYLHYFLEIKALSRMGSSHSHQTRWCQGSYYTTLYLYLILLPMACFL